MNIEAPHGCYVPLQAIAARCVDKTAKLMWVRVKNGQWHTAWLGCAGEPNMQAKKHDQHPKNYHVNLVITGPFQKRRATQAVRTIAACVCAK